MMSAPIKTPHEIDTASLCSKTVAVHMGITRRTLLRKLAEDEAFRQRLGAWRINDADQWNFHGRRFEDYLKAKGLHPTQM